MTAETVSLDLKEKLLTARELADYLGVHIDTVRGWKDVGPNRFKAGKTFRYRESDVLAWIEENSLKYGR
jgi:excisionase family DNA binding protein